MQKIPTPNLSREGINVLLVEDEDDLRFLLSRRLQRNGIKVSEAGTLAEAEPQLDALESSSFVILDINLPDGNGLSLLEKIREEYPPCTVIVYSAYSDREDAAYAAGANHFLVKPIDFKEVLSLLQA